MEGADKVIVQWSVGENMFIKVYIRLQPDEQK